MARCDVCGNDYKGTMTITMPGRSGTFDSFECAVHARAEGRQVEAHVGSAPTCHYFCRYFPHFARSCAPRHRGHKRTERPAKHPRSGNGMATETGRQKVAHAS